MDTIERVMRVMTHVNIGAGLGMAAWIAWSGLQVVGGDWKLPPQQQPSGVTERRGEGLPTRLPCCFVPAPRHGSEPPALQVRAEVLRVVAQADPRRAP